MTAIEMREVVVSLTELKVLVNRAEQITGTIRCTEGSVRFEGNDIIITMESDQ